MGRFEGKLVLITGASAGIGRATALAFAAEGARIVAVARRGEKLAELGQEGSLVAIVADVADGPSMEAMAARVLREVGVPDIVVANAGVGLDARFTEMTDAALRQVFEVNVFGVVRTIRPFLPGMLERRSGRILIVSSVVGLRGIPSYAAYSGSKFAVHGMAEALRTELHGSGVSVGLVCPSSTLTEFKDRTLRIGTPQRRKRLQYHSAESVARAILRMARSRRRIAVLSPEGKLMAALNVVAPGLLDRVLSRALVPRE